MLTLNERARLAGRRRLVLAYLDALAAHGFLPMPNYGVDANDHGFAPLLPPGMCRMTRDDLHRVAVAAFASSSTRTALWTAFERFLASLARLGASGECWVGGSFVSRKPDPCDVDFVVILNMEWVLALDPGQRFDLEEALDDAGSWRLDVSVMFDGDLILRAYWQGVLGFGRTGTSVKGIAVVPIEPTPARAERHGDYLLVGEGRIES